uniref:hypothetical protein n=1 Tax=Acidocella sp. C78 TaxID=1671486 RepID=UPI0020BF987A|nr:hypothetical protein [Acidocella sp. C78]
MFRSALALVVIGLFLAGCAMVTPPPSTGYLPANAFDGRVIGEDPAIAATNEARWAFSHPAAMRGRPAEMALAAASLDAMAGQFSTVGRWLGMNSLTKLEMLRARKVVRAELGSGQAPPRRPSSTRWSRSASTFATATGQRPSPPQADRHSPFRRAGRWRSSRISPPLPSPNEQPLLPAATSIRADRGHSSPAELRLREF